MDASLKDGASTGGGGFFLGSRGALDTLVAIWREGGVLALFRGAAPTVIGALLRHTDCTCARTIEAVVKVSLRVRVGYLCRVDHRPR